MPLPMYENQQVEEKKFPLKGVSKVIAIAAGKGGVGKSLMTAYLALALKQQGWRVGILDCDLYGPSMRNILPEDRMPAQKGNRLIPALTHGIPMLSMAYFRKKSDAVGVRAPIANKLLKHFIDEVDWGELDYLLLDFPPGTGDIQITLGQHMHIDAALLITTPQEISVIDVRKAASLFEQLHIPIAGVVENMSYYREQGSQQCVELFGSGGGERLALDLQVPLLAKIPLDPELGLAADQGRSPFLKDPESLPESLTELLALSQKLVTLIKESMLTDLPELFQSDRTHVEIQWNNGSSHRFRLAELQSCCPCASCQNNSTSPQFLHVEASSISRVGRYGIKIEFSSGCRYGIFSFEQLRNLALQVHP